MSDTLLSTVLQILVFSLIPFMVFLIRSRSVKGFFDYLGLKPSTNKANWLAVFASLIFVLPAMILTFTDDDFRGIMTHPDSISGHFRELGFGAQTVLMIIITAVFKTAFAEELFFRGFVAKRLISLAGYLPGNIIQALIFGAIHLALFAMISPNWFFLIFIFLFSGLGAFVSVYLNEKLAGGSIIPGWISHAIANLISYSLVAFVL